jgi:hypothetical protein
LRTAPFGNCRDATAIALISQPESTPDREDLRVPLTPAHAAAVIPLRRWKPYFWLSPLVVGSMAPDFPYYVFAHKSWRQFGHSAAGLFLICIPAGLAALYAYHRYFKRPLVLLLPRAMREKLWRHCGPFPFAPLPRLAWICALLLFGALTHVAWDSVTHEDTWLGRWCPQINGVFGTFAGHDLHVCGILQYGSSLLGLGLLARWSRQWYLAAPAGWAPPDSPVLGRARAAIMAASISFAIVVGVVCGLRCAFRHPGGFDASDVLAVVFICGTDAFCAAILVIVVMLHWRLSHGGADFPCFDNEETLPAAVPRS